MEFMESPSQTGLSPHRETRRMEAEELLLHLGVTPNYKSFAFLLTALELLQKDPSTLQLVTKNLYPTIARRHGTTWQAVERNLRTAASLVWRRNPILLQEMAGYPMVRQPTVSQFLSILLEQIITIEMPLNS